MRELAADQILVQLKMFLKAENDPNFLLSDQKKIGKIHLEQYRLILIVDFFFLI